MVVNRKVTGRARSVPNGLLLGGLTSLSITLLMTAGLTTVIEKEMLEQSNIGYGVMVMLLVASFLGAIVSSRTIKHRNLAMCLLSGVVYVVILMAITALFFGGQYQAVGVTSFLIFGGSAAAGLLEVKKGRERGRNKKKHR